MPKVKKGRKNGKISKKETKVKGRAKDEVKLPAPMIDVKVKFDPDDQTFTYRDAKKVMEADNDATDCTMELSEYVRSIRPEVMEDIKPKIEPIVKEEPSDPEFNVDPEIIELDTEDDAEINTEILEVPLKKKRQSKKSIECSICHKKFKNSQCLAQHRNVHKAKTLKCDICEKLFATKNQLNEHKWTHSLNRKMYPCDVCQKEYLRKSHLKRHQNVHALSRKMFSCQICEKNFFSSNGLKDHVQITHEGIKRKQKEKRNCTYCNKKFTRDCELIDHMRSEHFTLIRQQDEGTGDLHPLFQGVRTFECYRCKHSSGFSANVKNHMKSCEGIKPIKCKLCEKRFRKICSLKDHMRHNHLIFEGKQKIEQALQKAERTFECIDCKMCFTTKYVLIQHIKLRCDKNGFTCDYCIEKFPRKIDKDEHHRCVHPILLKTSHNQQFECHVCKVDIPVHMAVRHLVEKHRIRNIFECYICNTKLSSRAAFKRHTLWHGTKERRSENI